MADPVRVTIKAAEAGGTDAPTVDDLLGQIRDFIDILKGVERALNDGAQDLVWRVTNATMNSPLDLELTPFAKNPAAYIGDRAREVELAASVGLRSFVQGETRPAYFTDDVLDGARRLHARVTSGLSAMTVAFSDTIQSDPIIINQDVARTATIARIREEEQKDIPYIELGGIEGFAAKVELDGFNRPLLWFRTRLDNVLIKAIGRGDAFRHLAGLRLSTVWDGARVRVYGTIHYKSLGEVDYMEAEEVELLDTEELPDLDDIIDPDFTGGLSTEDYLNEVRRA